MPNKGNLSTDQMRETYRWIASAVVLHNLLQADPWDDVDGELEPADNGAGDDFPRAGGGHNGDLEGGNRGMIRREMMLQQFLEEEKDMM